MGGRTACAGNAMVMDLFSRSSLRGRRPKQSRAVGASRPGLLRRHSPSKTGVAVCTMLPIGLGREGLASVRPFDRRNPEDDLDAIVVDLDAAYDGVDDLPHPAPIEAIEALPDLGGKFLEAADHQ